MVVTIRIMSNLNKRTLSEDKIMYILLGGIVSVGILYLPNAMVEKSKQDGWISVIFGVVYPLYIIMIACFLKKHHPKENVLQLSNKFFGKYLGTLFNLLFSILFIMNVVLSPVGMSNFIRSYISEFITHIQFIIIFLLIGAYAAHKGIEVIIKLSEVVFYGGIIIFFLGLSVLKYGNILNIQPIMGTGIKSIIKGSIDSMYAYSCIELIFIIYPLFKDKKKIRKYGLLTVLISCTIYTWTVFAAIFYIGPDLIEKTLWSSVYIIESIKLPIINNLRFIVFFFWGILSLKSISIYYYALDAIFKHIFKPKKISEYYLLIYPLAVFVAYNFKNEIVKREFAAKILPYIFLYNVIYVTVISIIVLIKKDDSIEG